MGWVSPTGYNDPDNHWNRNGTPALCYDEDTATECDPQSWTANTWCPFVEFTHAALSCDKVRHWVDWFTQIDIDVYYDGVWHDVYEGTTTGAEWVEKDIPSAPQTITAFRIRGQYSTVYGRGIWEVDFGEVTLKTSSDTGVGAEVSNFAFKDLFCSDTGAGVEVANFTLKGLLSLDTGSGVGAVVSRLLAGADAGVAVEAIVARAIQALEAGTGLEEVIARALQAFETATGVDSLVDLGYFRTLLVKVLTSQYRKVKSFTSGG